MNTAFASGNPYTRPGFSCEKDARPQHQAPRVYNNRTTSNSHRANRQRPLWMQHVLLQRANFARNSYGYDGNKEDHHQPQDMQSTDSTRPNMNSFDNVGFDPNSVHGEEEDEYLNHHNDSQSTAPYYHGNYNAASTNSSVTKAYGRASDKHRQQKPHPSETSYSRKNVPSREQDNARGADKNPLCTNQLLQLFTSATQNASLKNP